MKTVWNLYKPDNVKVNVIKEKYKVSNLVATILANRTKKTINNIDDFLEPTLSKLHSPFLLNDMERAVNRIIKAVNERSLIIIYGDYDVDGVTATSILYTYLLSIGADVTYYIPNRFEEGYGLNIEAMDKLCDKKPDLIITVDCGIASVAEVEFLNEKGIDIIITDHHECQENLPKAFAVIDPKRNDSTYPFRFLCGAGVSFKLIQAISNTITGNKDIPTEYLDLVTLATIADIVPLVDENRVIVKAGIEYIANTNNKGLKSMIQVADIKDINVFTVGFGLAPRINAAGRRGIANRAVDMFTTQDDMLAKKLAEELDNENKKRQMIEGELTSKIIEIIETEKLYDEKVIIVSGEDWHHGIIGIIASKLVDKYYKPCIIVSFDNGIGTGSCRSVDGVNIFGLLSKVSDCLIKFGGHELAAGLSLEQEQFEKFKQEVKQVASNDILATDLEKKIKVEYLLRKEDLELETIEGLKILEPYGSDNPQPYVGISSCKVEDIMTLSEGKHLKIRTNINGKILYAIGFGMGDMVNDIKIGQNIGMVGFVNINEFNGNRSIQLNLKDIKKC